MTKKDYVLIASAINMTIKESLQTNRSFDTNELIGRLCVELTEDNAKFNSVRFIEACKAV